MNNGLRGRYLPSLEAWNNARRFAADLVEAYHDGDHAIEKLISEWQIGHVLTSISPLKDLMSKALFLHGRNAIDKIARSLIQIDGWSDAIPPSETNKTVRMPGHPAEAA